MKARAMLSGLVVLLLAAEERPTLKEFTSREGGFSVRVPGEMKETVKTVTRDGKSGEQRTYTYSPDPKVTYLVLVRDRPDLAEASTEAVEKELESAARSAAESLKGKLLSTKPITLGRYPGRELQVEPSDGLYRARVFVAGGRLYEVTILAPKDVATAKAADEYLRSFKLRDKE